MKNRKETHQSQGVQRKNAIKENPENIINNPALEYGGTSAVNSGLSSPGHSLGGGLANSTRLNHYNTISDSDYNRAGNIRNQGENEQNYNKNLDFNAARSLGKASEKEGKTMVKNVGMHENGEA
jgi:hypothetical protein